MSARIGSVRLVLGGALLGAVLVVAAALVSWGTTSAQFTDSARVTTVRVTVGGSTGQDIARPNLAHSHSAGPHVNGYLPPVALGARGKSALGGKHGHGDAKQFLVTPFGRVIHIG
ncbi:MAG: hypothetical protein ACRDRN_05905 [Sciscionella sp.]